jgi:hypothetical protein
VRVAPGDFKRLRWPLAAAVALLALGAAFVFVTAQRLNVATKTRDAARSSRVSAQERVSRVSEEERSIRDNLVYYEQMREAGMIGGQSRLDWIETITKIKNDRKLFEVRYSIEAQKPLDYPGIVATGGAEFVMSRVTLTMLLLHEGDFLDFMSDLRASGKAFVSVRRCSVDRIERGSVISPTALQPRLRAECQVDLISVRGIKPA